VTQTWKGEVKGKHQSFLICELVQQKAPCVNKLLMRHIYGRMPFRMLDVNGMEKHVRYAEQLLSL